MWDALELLVISMAVLSWRYSARFSKSCKRLIYPESNHYKEARKARNDPRLALPRGTYYLIRRKLD